MQVLILGSQGYQVPNTVLNHLHLEHWCEQDDEDQIDILLCKFIEIVECFKSLEFMFE